MLEHKQPRNPIIVRDGESEPSVSFQVDNLEPTATMVVALNFPESLDMEQWLAVVQRIQQALEGFRGSVIPVPLSAPQLRSLCSVRIKTLVPFGPDGTSYSLPPLRYVGDLIALTEDRFRKMYTMSDESFNYLRDQLSKVGLQFGIHHHLEQVRWQRPNFRLDE